MIANVFIIIAWIFIGILSSFNSSYNIGAIITIWLATLIIIISRIQIYIISKRS